MANTSPTHRFESKFGQRRPPHQIYQHMSHGPILPMEEPGFLARLFHRR